MTTSDELYTAPIHTASILASRLGRALVVNLWGEVVSDGIEEAERVLGMLSRMFESYRAREKDAELKNSPKRWLPKKGGR